MKRISAFSVAARTGGAVLMAGTVFLSVSVAVAGPSTSGYGPPKDGAIDLGGLDLPISAPVYDPNPPAPNAPPAPPEQQPDQGDPRDEPPPVFFGEELNTANDTIIYVVDNSGSMTIAVNPFENEEGQIVHGNRLDRAKSELRRSISALPHSFQFNVMFFDECVRTCWPSKRPASLENKQAALSWIAGVQPMGWTNSGLAVSTALADKDVKTIALLSDGSPNFLDCAMHYVGTFEQHREMIRGANTQGARIEAFGIGIEGDTDARNFMQQVAAQNGGSYVDVR